MPVFINEVVFRGDIQGDGNQRDAADGNVNADSARHEALIAEVTQAVLDHLERGLDRTGER